MHPFIFMDVVHHVILIAVLAFFVLFAASKADGFVKILGNVLGYLILICAVVWLVGCLTAPMFGGHPFGLDMWGMGPHWGYMHGAPPPAVH
jgi:hypothetical protein